MIKADTASITWQTAKKQWTVVIHAGAEVIKRAPGTRLPREAADETLRSAALDIARDDGYELPPERVAIER